jgi:outer membrane protein, heavy metal efflux system
VEAKLLQTPDIKQWEVKRNQQEALYELEKAKAIPNPRLRFGVRDLRETGDQAFMAGLSIPIPVFNANTGNITSAKSNLSRSQSDGDATHIDLRNTLYHRLEEMVNSYHQANTLTADIIPSAEDAFALSRKGYNSGSFPYLEVLDAQRTLFEAKEQYIKTLEEYHTARANVERLTTIAGEQ